MFTQPVSLVVILSIARSGISAIDGSSGFFGKIGKAVRNKAGGLKQL